MERRSPQPPAQASMQYSAATFADLCDHHGVVQSMGRIGDSLDNAAAESCFATLKRELGARWDSVEQARPGWRSSPGSRSTTTAGASSPEVADGIKAIHRLLRTPPETG